MQKMFLASLFKDVKRNFSAFAKEDLMGKTVTFIPTAALPDKFNFHIKYSQRLLTKMGLQKCKLYRLGHFLHRQK